MGPYLLDTNIAIHLRDGDPVTLDAVAAANAPILISVITRVELEGGVHRDPAFAQARRLRLDAVLDAVPVLAFDDEAARIYGEIVAQVGYARRKILDRMIAAQALQHHATLVTRDPDDFADVPGLSLERW